MRFGMKNKTQPILQYIGQNDVILVINTVFAYALTEARTQTLWWAQWRSYRWQNAANIWSVWSI